MSPADTPAAPLPHPNQFALTPQSEGPALPVQACAARVAGWAEH